jgi:isocitrate/isopropylmalate dehydrogenase
MKTHSIAVIGGDGTGPEVTREAIKVCEAAGAKFGFKLDWHHFFLSETQAGAAIEAAVIKIINTRIQSLAAGKMGHGTREVGDLVAGAL